jgi:hypothetical protein
MPSTYAARKDDVLTIVSLAILACIAQDILHEGIGHGLTAWLSGARLVTISTVAMQSDISTRWISANGTLVNLIVAALIWLILRSRPANSTLRYFLILALAGNLFTGTGYFLFSGFTDFGDWAAVIKGVHPRWAWRIGLIVVGIISYYASMLLVAAELRPYQSSAYRRIRRLTWIPYFTDGILAAVAGLFNPAGLFYVIASALPSTLGANAGLFSLPSMLRNRALPEDSQLAPLPRSIPCIVAAAIATLWFVFVLGRGLTWSR